METVTTQKNLNDVVWLMEDNKAVSKTITGIMVTKTADGTSELYFLPDDPESKSGKWLSPEVLFTTKDALLKSL